MTGAEPVRGGHSDHPGERRAWGWVEGLRSGSTEGWQGWQRHSDRVGRALPGAQQLELLRRLNEVGPPSSRLAERVLQASAPGRGTPDLPLTGAFEESSFGPRPTDPADLPEAELVRVATDLIADDLVAAGHPPEVRPPLTRPWRRRYRLVGDLWLADPARDGLRRRGRPPGGRRAMVFVLGTDLASMITHAWSARAFDEGGPGWGDWLDEFAALDRLPPRADLLAAARRWRERVGADRVTVVLDGAALPRLTGTRRRLPGPPRLDADGLDLVRRVSTPLGLLMRPEQRTRLLRETLAPRLEALPIERGQPLGVPPRHEEWVRRRAQRLREDLIAGGYPVVGDPDSLVPDLGEATRRAGHPTDAGVLRLALAILLDTDRTTQERFV